MPEPGRSAPLAPLAHSAAAERNRGPILQVLQALLPPRASVLEIASGTGQHAAFFAAAQPQWIWQPSEHAADALATIALRCDALSNVHPPLQLDVLEAWWPVEPQSFDTVYCANMIHIAPWECCVALMRGSRAALRVGGSLLLYGPFIEDEVPTAASNLAFDEGLRRRDPAWGVRRLADVAEQAAHHGLSLRSRTQMPSNNLLLQFA